jgi:hypothetical protein
MKTFGNKKSQKIPTVFCCEPCDYKTCNKKDFTKHCQTKKHAWSQNQHLSTNLSQKIPIFVCSCCGKEYKERTGLWKHKKICDDNINVIDNDNSNNNMQTNNKINIDNDLFSLFVKENSELKSMIMEVIKNGTHNTTTTYNTNSNNKSFNLNVFLNETCKDAMNISDFMNSVQIQLSDLENVGNQGFINGITNIIVKKLKSLDITQRPVHCTDAKREVLYIKDENKWEKENEENNKLRRVIKNVAYRNSKMLSAFREKHPDCCKSDSKYADKYNKLVIEAMGGKGDNDKEKEDKIIKNIAKEVVIEK